MKRILIFGDSNSWGYDYMTYEKKYDSGKRMDENTRYPMLLQKSLGNEYRIIEDCLNARTCMWDDPFSEGRNGYEALKISLDANAPLDLVVINLGANDIKEYFNLTPYEIAQGAKKLIELTGTDYYGYKAPKVLLIAPPPVPEGIGIDGQFAGEFGAKASERSRGLSQEYKKVADGCKVRFLDAGMFGLELNTVDYLHYSKNDHKIVADILTVKIKEILG